MHALQHEVPLNCEDRRATLITCYGAGESRRSVEELSLLFDISCTMESSQDLKEVVRRALIELAEALEVKRGAIAVLNREHDRVSIGEAVGIPMGTNAEHYLDQCRELMDRVMSAGQAVVVPDISAHRATRKLCSCDSTQLCRDDRPVAFICVPIKFGDQVFGSLSVERVVDSESDLSADCRLLSTIGSVIARSVQFRLTAMRRLEDLQRENERLQEQIQAHFRPDNMVGNSSAMRSLFRQIEEVAVCNTAVLIRGENGVGKDTVARAMHNQSLRKQQAFVKFDCAALPESIIESELFGLERGAFAGAIAMRKGGFEIADRGTIFLDEIGNLSPATQVKLLRVLQQKEFMRVGGIAPIKCDVRIIAATSRNLEEMVEQGKFRSDLYYRLNVFPVYVPPLRERRSDILLLADYFAERFSVAHRKKIRRISTAAIDLVAGYHWPGNVRELENCMERAVLSCNGNSVEAHHLPPTLQKKDPSEAEPSGTLDAAVSALEYEMIVAELKTCNGNMAKAARNLGVTERQIGLRVKRYKLDFKRFRGSHETTAKTP